MNKFKYFILIIVALVSFLNPVLKTNAEIEYKFLAPLPNPASGAIDDTLKINDNSFTTYLNMLIKLTIGVAGVLTVVMIVMGGIQYMGSELISSKEQGKSQITNALFGLLITLGAYALLYTINPDILKADPSKSMRPVIVTINDNTPQTPDAHNKYSDGRTKGEVIPTAGRTQLPPYATLNNGGVQCAKVGDPNCTSTFNLNIDKLSKIHEGCNCSFVITGGTETWSHGPETTHVPGSGTVDLHVTEDLNKYFTGSTATPNQDWYRTPDGGWALYEVHDGVNHWHYNPTDRK